MAAKLTDLQPVVALDDAATPVVDALMALLIALHLDPVLRGTYPAELRGDLRPPDELIRDGVHEA